MGNVYHGSVKNVIEVVPATTERFGRGIMHFEGDPFSVFDYGKMPWDIPGKGEDLYRESLRFLEVLEAEGIPTHFTQDEGLRKIGILLARMLEYDEIEEGKTVIYRVPIECVYSKVITPPASAHGRLRRGEEPPSKYGADHVPERGEKLILPAPATSYSTKIETGEDIYKGLQAMARLAGLIGNEDERIDALTIASAIALIRDAEDIGLLLADGKDEYVMGPGRNLLVADTGYTWDENRWLRELPDGRWVDLSKQLPRNIYTIMGWKKRLKRAQKKYPRWKSRWPKPPPLTDEQMGVCIEACHAVRAAITRQRGADRKLDKAARHALDVLDALKDEYRRDETGAEI